MNERSLYGSVCIASCEGGVNNEDVTEKSPDVIITFPINVVQGLDAAGAKEIAIAIEIHHKKVDEVAKILINLFDLFPAKDTPVVEINHFTVDNNGEFVYLDAKIKVDADTEFRQKAVFDQ